MSKELQTTNQKESLLRAIAIQWGCPEIEPKKLYETLKATAFKGKKNGDTFIPVTDEQFLALSIVSKQYRLNPFLKEIYAYPDKQGGIVPVVGVDGWANIINAHPQMDGMEYRYSENFITIGKSKKCYEWIECIITRKDRSKPIVIREYLDECYQEPNFATPWQTHTKRFLRHKATIQAGRMAFGFGGIYDEDEAEQIMKDVTPKISQSTVNDLNAEFLGTKEVLEPTRTDPLNASIDAAMSEREPVGDNPSPVEEVSLENRVSSMLAELSMDAAIVETEDFQEVWQLVKKSGNKTLLKAMSEALA